jgi:hypothetical protein
MRAFLLIRTVSAALLLGGCSYYHDVPDYGLSFLVSRDDLKAATAVVFKEQGRREIYAYRVNDKDNIQLLLTPEKKW